MDIIFSHKSALEYWRLHSDTKNSDLEKQKKKRSKKRPPVSFPRATDICGIATSELSYPISIMLGSKNANQKSEIFRTHVYTGQAPGGCFVGIGEGLAVSSPSFCFFQMANELPLAKLIELGFELCGTYSLPAKSRHDDDSRSGHGGGQSNGEEIDDRILHGDRAIGIDYNAYREWEEAVAKTSYSDGEEIVDKTVYGHPRLTNTKELKNLTARMKSVNGQKKACRALRYILDGSASPMETILCMLLTLPHKLGGYGLPAPELNRRVDIGDTSKNRSGKSFYVCDLFWPKAGLAVEYDSDSYHSGADRIAADSRKRLELATLGITVITVTSRQVRNAIEFEGLAKLISRKVGKQLRYKNPEFQKAHRELRSMLL